MLKWRFQERSFAFAPDPDADDEGIDDVAADFLGISQEEADLLFAGGNDLDFHVGFEAATKRKRRGQQTWIHMTFADGEQYGSLFAGVGPSGSFISRPLYYAASVPVLQKSCNTLK